MGPMLSDSVRVGDLVLMVDIDASNASANAGSRFTADIYFTPGGLSSPKRCRMGLRPLNRLCVDFNRANLTLDLGFLLIAHDSQIELGLKIEPKTGSGSERTTEP